MGGKNQTTTQQSTSTPTGIAQLQDIYNRVSQVASQPYTPYGGNMVAGLSPTQQAGIQGVTNAQGAAQPYFDQAANYATQGAAPIDPSQIQRYMSPYTQSVIDATKANFKQDNAIGQQQVIGNAAAKGALGGDRVGVAQAELARQQGLAQNPVIAGLYSGAYDKALGAAQQDRAAQAQGAYTFGALAPSVQNAQISGAQAQIGAGGLEQGTNQAQLSAAYNQYLQQLAFPYQQAGFLASAGLPAANAMGGSSTGSTTAPGPNPWSQIAGVGLTAAMALSDRRIKRDIKEIGKTYDNQPIYSYKLGDNPTTQIGLMAQDVEHKHPEAVGNIGGIKTVDYDSATTDAAEKRKFASGGPVGFFDVDTYVPKFSGIQSMSPYGQAPGLPAIGKPVADPAMAAPGQIKGASEGLRSLFGGMFQPEGGMYDANMAGAIPSAVTGMVGGGLKRGGRVSRHPQIFRSGGRVTDKHAKFHATVHTIRQTIRGGSPRGYAEGGDVSPNDYVNHVFADAGTAVNDGTLDPQGINAMGPAAFEPRQSSPFADGPVPMPTPRPNVAHEGLPPVMTADAGLPENAMAYGAPPPSPYAAAAPGGPPMAPAPTGASAPPAKPSSGLFGWNPMGLSEEARTALMSAGLGMMASRSPFALSAIGEGGLQGVKSYSEQKAQKQKVDSEARRLAQQAEQFAQNLGLHRDQFAESKRQHDIAERKTLIPPGFRQTDDGSLEAVPGGPQDPAFVKAQADAKRGTAGLLDADTIKDMAGQYLAGDKSVMTNLGRGMQGAENIVKLRAEIARQAREAGMKPDQIATRMADFAGRTAAMRTLGTRGANVEYAGNTAANAIKLAEEASDKLPRTQFVPFNKLKQLVDTSLSSPEQADFFTKTNTLVNEYARVTSGGSSQSTESQRQHARELLNTAQGPAAYKAVLNAMRQEIAAAKKAYQDTRKEFLEDHTAPAASGIAPPSPTGPNKFGSPADVQQAIKNGTLKRGDTFLDANGTLRTVP